LFPSTKNQFFALKYGGCSVFQLDNQNSLSLFILFQTKKLSASETYSLIGELKWKYY